MQNMSFRHWKLYQLWYGSDLAHNHARRVRRALMVGSAAMILMGFSWGIFFYCLKNWPVVSLDALMVVGGFVTIALIAALKPHTAAIVSIATLFIVICTIAWAFDAGTVQAPRTTQLYLLPLSVVATMAFRTSPVWLRFGVPGACLIALALLSLNYGTPFPQYALPENIRAYGSSAQVIFALALFFVMLQVMQHEAIARSALEADIELALERSEFRLYYQPQFDSAGRILGAEALIRWEHPERGLVMPGEFIEKAEQTGQILPIGDWVARQACAQLKSWSQLDEFKHLRIAINVSQVQVQQKDFVPHILGLLGQHEIEPSQLELELTESMLASNILDVIEKMKSLHERGVTFSLDDFGTGYSSLNHLKKLPLHQLKIDQSFVKDVTTNPSDASIVKTIIALGHNLGLTVIAEGVETAEQHRFLKECGCEQFQGYLFSQALPLDKFTGFVRANVSAVAEARA